MPSMRSSPRSPASIRVVSRCCLALAAGLVSLPATGANGYFLHGYSAPQRAMAGAGTALAGEAAQLPVNPAGILGVRSQWTADLNLILAYNDTEISERPAGAGAGLFSIEPDALHSQAENFLLPFAAYAKAIDADSAWSMSINGGGLKSLYRGGQARFADGLPGLSTRCAGVFGGGSVLAGSTDPGGFCGGGDHVASGDLILVFLRAGYARRVNESLVLGVSPILAVESFKARGLRAFDRYSVAPGRVTDNGHAKRPSLGIGARLGLLWSATDTLSLGASWQSRIRIGRFEEYGGTAPDGGRIDSPEMWNAGLAWAPSPGSLLAMDYERIRYSDIPILGRRFDAGVFAEQCLLPRLLLGGEPDASCFGGARSPGFGWQDTHSYKLGYRFSPSASLAFSLGYTWTERAVQDDQALFNILAPGVSEDHYAAGASWRVRPGLSLNFAALYAPRRGVRGQNPLSHVDASALLTPGEAEGDTGLFGTDPLDQQIEVSAQVIELVFGVQIGF